MMSPEKKQQCVEDALNMHKMSYNCAQCVALAVCQEVGLDKDDLFRIMEGFGGGMGGFTQTCGAISGGIAVISQASCNGMEACNSKKDTYGWAKEFVEQFEAEFQSASCADLRPEEPELRMPTCNGYITYCVEAALDMVDRIREAKQAEGA